MLALTLCVREYKEYQELSDTSENLKKTLIGHSKYEQNQSVFCKVTQILIDVV